MSHTFEHRNFMIFNTSELEQIDFNEVLESSTETVRKSNDGTLTFVKWEGDITPPSVEALTSKIGPYNYEEMLEILNGPEWTLLSI